MNSLHNTLNPATNNVSAKLEREKELEFSVLKRDVYTVERRHDFLLGPTNEQNHLKLDRYQVTEEELRNTRKWLAQRHCIIDRVTMTGVTLNDKKAKILAQGISANDTINELKIVKCKIRFNHMEMLCQAIGLNESIEYVRIEKCNLL